MRRRIDGMVVAITGASAGIGKALAEALHARGAKLALCARRLENLQKLNESLGGKHLIFRADVAERIDCELFINAALERFNRIDTVIPNAGFGLYHRTHETSAEEMRRIFATNVFGTTDIIHAVIPAMIAQEKRDGLRGQVMIVSSAAARRGIPYLGPYCATKAAQLSLAEALRVELKPMRIAVTSVHPVMTKTEFGAAAEQASNIKLPRDGSGASNTLEKLVAKMIRAIEKPRPEVWTHHPTRMALAFAAVFPRIADKALDRYRRSVQAENAKPK